MTEEQRQKVKAALLYKHLEAFEQSMALDRHYKAIEWITAYNLPYRINLEYLKGSSRDYVQINPCYPAPGYCIDDLIALKPGEVDISYDLDITPKDEATRQKIKECCDKLRPWDLSTAAGRKKWEYEFAHFLNAAQLNTFTYFDWFGVKSAPPKEQEKNQQKIYYWLNLQADYQMNPGNYRQEEPLRKDYEDNYTTNEFIIDWDGSTQYRDSMM